jgi:acetolactate synthase-1/2/3 large subunit
MAHKRGRAGKKTVWQVVVEALEAEGTEVIFGLPGNPAHLVADLVKHSNIKLVLTRHEHGGVACAYAFARVSNGPAVCFGNPGPGITNMTTGLLEATCGSLPVICLTNGVPMASDGRGAFQELDSIALMRPVTKWAVRPTAADAVPWTLQRAFSVAKNGRPGAVFIDIPSDLGLIEAVMPAYAPSLERQRFRPDPDAVSGAARLLARAKRPLILCGSGAISSGAAAAVADLSDRLGIPVFTTPGGRGIFPEAHPLSLGQVGLYFSEVGKAYYDEADLILSVGSRLEEFSTGGWKYFPKRGRLIQLDIEPEAIGLNFRPDVALVGDATLALNDVIAALGRITSKLRDTRVDAIAKAKAPHLRKVEREGARRGGKLRTPQILHGVMKVFGKDTILVNENGGADLWSYYWPYYRVQDIGDCVPMAEQTAMGMGVIGTIGAKLAAPDKKVVCVAGDGAMQMAMMELATAAEQNCGITWIVLNNQALGWPQYIQMLEGQATAGTDFNVSPDFAKLAEAQGCLGLKVAKLDEIEGALKRALRANRKGRPALVEFRIGKHDYPAQFARYHQEIWGLGVPEKAAKRRTATGGGD